MQSIFSTTSAFAALKADGSVVTWGKVIDQVKAVSEPLNKLHESGAVTCIACTDNAISALKADGSVVAWGDCEGYSKVKEQLAADVQSIHSANYAVAALKADGSVVAWGSAGTGMYVGFSQVREQLVVDVCTSTSWPWTSLQSPP